MNIGPTDWLDATRPKSKRFILPGTDIHGWTPFVVAHPACFALDEGPNALNALIDAALTFKRRIERDQQKPELTE